MRRFIAGIAVVAMFILAMPTCLAARSYNVVPEPAYTDIEAEGDYVVTSKTRIVVQDGLWNPAERFAEDMMSYFGLKKPMHVIKRAKGVKGINVEISFIDCTSVFLVINMRLFRELNLL